MFKLDDKLIKQFGIWAALFVALLGYVLYTNNDREQRYLNTIDKLNDTVIIDLKELKAMHQKST